MKASNLLRHWATPFDPAKMEAITTVPSTDEYGAGTVVSVLESGWVLRGQGAKGGTRCRRFK